MRKVLVLSLLTLFAVYVTACSGNKGIFDDQIGKGGSIADSMSMFPEFDFDDVGVSYSHILTAYRVPKKTALAINTTLGTLGKWTVVGNYQGGTTWGMANFDDYDRIYYSINFGDSASMLYLSFYTNGRISTYDDFVSLFPLFGDGAFYATQQYVYYTNDNLNDKFHSYRDRLIDEGVFAASDCTDNAIDIVCYWHNGADEKRWHTSTENKLIFFKYVDDSN